MASAFNLTAQINLQGPTNLGPIISNIKKQINGANIKLNLDVNPASAKNITGITQRLNSLSKAATNANNNVGNLNATLSKLGGTFSNLSSALNANTSAVTKTASAVSSAGKSVSQTTTAIQEFGKQSGLAIKRFAAFSSVTTVVFSLVNAVNSAFGEFVNFNKEIVRLSQVTGKSVSDLGDVTKEITRLSTTLGVASSDLLNVATTLAQAGLSAEDTKIALEALAESALAPSFDNLANTTEGAIAAFRQFGLQSTDLKSALGSINSVAAAFAVESGDIITAIQRAGSAFSSSSRGVSEGKDALNEFIAVFTSVRATTRESAETIATGLRTIFTRIQRGKTIDLLKQYGVELRDLEGKFVGPYEATKRLATGLSSIDPRSSQFAAIAEELGGFRQINKVIPLLQQFAVAEQALSVAQKGAGSTAKDAQTAQQSLAVQFIKTRESFVALVREIGDSSTFKAFVGLSLTLTNGFINLARALKPLLPLLLTFASIKAGGAAKEFFGGFQLPFGGGGGGGATGGGSSPTRGGGSGGSGGAAATIGAINSNTSILTTNTQILTGLNQSILALNQNVVNNNSLLLNKPAKGFATGGLVPGSGNRDTVSARLTPGEFVIRKKAVEAIGVDNLAQMNTGGSVQKFKNGSLVRRNKKGRTGARSGFRDLSDDELDQLSTADLIKYAKAQVRNIFTTGGSGMATSMKFIEVPAERIVPELEGDLTTYLGKKGFWSEQVSPFGRSISKGKKTDAGSRASAMQLQMSKQADEVAARSQQWSSISSGSGIDNYLLQSLTDPILSDYKTVRGGGSLDKAFHNTRLRKAVNTALESYDDFDYSANNIDKLVSNMAAKRFASGGLVQKFAQGSPGGVKKPKLSSEEYKQLVQQRVKENNGNILEFGLVGLRSGLSNAGAISQNFSETQITPKTQTPVKINVATIAQNYSDALGQELETKLFNSFKSSVKNIAGTLSGKLPGGGGLISDNETIDKIINNAGFTGVVGAGLEAALGLIGAPYVEKQEKTKAIDFPLGLGGAAGLFGIDPNIPTDATRTIGGYGKSVGGILGQIDRYLEAKSSGAFVEAEANKMSIMQAQSLTPMLESIKSRVPKGSGIAAMDSAKAKELRDKYGLKSGGLNIPSLTSSLQRLPSDQQRPFLDDLSAFLNAKGYAKGGSVEDTVPALLTPGEFVFNKKTAQSIGYNNLNKLNKVQGFNKGGVVGYARGGIVDNMGGTAGGIAAIVAILLPEVQKLAGGFAELKGEAATYGAALSGATREASSLALSTGIALKAIGASQQLTGTAVAGAAISGAVSGALTDGAAKALERALLKNVETFSKFDKNLQDISNAPTEELRIEAAERLEKTFNTLDISVNSAASSIDFLENAKRAGESLNNFTLSVVTGLTAFNALKSAVETAQKAVAASQTFSGTGAFGRNPAGPAVGGVVKLFATFGKFIPYVGLAITGFSLLTEGMKLFGSSLTKNNEQFDRLYKSLDETTKNSRAFTLANKNFVDKILPGFASARTAAGGDRGQLLESLGSIKTNNNVNELNLTFRTLLKSKLATQGLSLSDDKSIQEFRSGLTADSKVFNTALEEATKEFTQRQFIAAQVEGGVSPENAQAEFSRLSRLGASGTDIINSIINQYLGAKNLEILALRELAAANSKVKINLANLDNILISLNAQLQSTLDKTINRFDDLDKRISIIGGEAQPTGGEYLRRNLSTLNNLQGASKEDVGGVTATVANLLNIQSPTTDSDSKKIFQELSTQVEAQRLLQQEFPSVLQEIAKSPQGIAQTENIINNRLREPLTNIVGGGENSQATVDKLLTEISSNLAKSLSSGEVITSLEDFARKNESVAALLKQGEPSIKAYNTIIENAAKVQDKVAEQNKKIIDIQNSLTQSLIDRRKNEIQNNLDLKRTLGQDVSLKELNSVFESEIKTLTENIGGKLPQQGTANVTSIIAELKARKASQKSIEDQIKQSQLSGESSKDLVNQQTAEINNVNKLTKALQTFVSSTDKAKNALEKIAEAQNLFKSQEETLLELIEGAKDPETALQQSMIMQAIQAVESGRSSSAQRTLVAKEGLRFVNATRSQGEAQNFREKLLDQSVNSTVPTTLAEVAAKAFAMMFLKTRNSVGPQDELKKAQKERDAAAKDLEAQGLEQIGTITTQTSAIFKSFNQELSGIFPGIILNLKRIEASMKRDTLGAAAPETFKAPGDFSTELRTKLSDIKRPSSYMDTLTESDSPIQDIMAVSSVIKEAMFGAPNLLQTQDIDAIMAVLGNDGPIAALKRADDLISAKLGDKSPINNQKLKNSLDAFGKFETRFLELQRQFESDQKIDTPLPGSPFPSNRNRYDSSPRPLGGAFGAPDVRRIQNAPSPPSPVDSGSILKFNDTVTKLANVFETNNQPLQNLSDSIGTFSTTATLLTNALKDFSNKFEKGMNGQISYTGDVNLNFNDSLDINIPNKNQTLISDLEPRLKDIIKFSVEKGFEKAKNG